MAVMCWTVLGCFQLFPPAAMLSSPKTQTRCSLNMKLQPRRPLTHRKDRKPQNKNAVKQKKKLHRLNKQVTMRLLVSFNSADRETCLLEPGQLFHPAASPACQAKLIGFWLQLHIKCTDTSAIDPLIQLLSRK